MDALHRLAHFLLEKETITGEEFMDLLLNPSKSVAKETLSRNDGGFPFAYTHNKEQTRKRGRTHWSAPKHIQLYLSERTESLPDAQT